MKDILAKVSVFDHMTFQLKMAGYRADALETAVFARQLEHIMSQTYDKEFPEVKVRGILPVNSQVNTGALSHTFRQFESIGKAKLVSAYGSTDFPNVDIVGREFNQLIHSIGLSYGYSIQDMRAASMAGVNLDQKKAETARLAFEQILDELGAVGDVNMGQGTIPGITNAGGIVTSASAASTGVVSSDGVNTLTGSWDDPNTPVESILADLNKGQKIIFDLTKGIYGDDLELRLSTGVYSALATRARSVTFTEDSVLQYMLKQSPWLKEIDYWVQLDALGKTSTAAAGGLGLMKARSPRVAELVIPQDFEQFPPQLEGLAWRILCHGRCGGVSVRYPKAVHTLNGLQK